MVNEGVKKGWVGLKHMEGNVLKDLQSLGIHVDLAKDRAQQKKKIYIGDRHCLRIGFSPVGPFEEKKVVIFFFDKVKFY